MHMFIEIYGTFPLIYCL